MAVAYNSGLTGKPPRKSCTSWVALATSMPRFPRAAIISSSWLPAFINRSARSMSDTRRLFVISQFDHPLNCLFNGTATDIGAGLRCHRADRGGNRPPLLCRGLRAGLRRRFFAGSYGAPPNASSTSDCAQIGGDCWPRSHACNVRVLSPGISCVALACESPSRRRTALSCSAKVISGLLMNAAYVTHVGSAIGKRVLPQYCLWAIKVRQGIYFRPASTRTCAGGTLPNYPFSKRPVVKLSDGELCFDQRTTNRKAHNETLV